MTFSKGHKLDLNPHPKRSPVLFYFRSIRGLETEKIAPNVSLLQSVMVKYAVQLVLSSSPGFLLPLVSLKPK